MTAPLGIKYGLSKQVALVTGSFTLKIRAFCQKLTAFQERWSLLVVVSQDMFYRRAKRKKKMVFSGNRVLAVYFDSELFSLFTTVAPCEIAI